MKWYIRILNASAARVARHYYREALESYGQRLVGRVRIVGAARFGDEVAESLRILGRYYPFGYKLVQRYIHAVVALEPRIDFGFVIGVCFEPPTPAGGLRWHPDRFAGILLRDAIYTRLTRAHDVCVWRNAKVQIPVLKKELWWLRRIRSHPAYITQQEEFVAEKEKRVTG
jgi:hypothetical protein